MAKVTGQVQAVSTKFSKVSVMVDDTWYATKQEWFKGPMPNKGDEVEFDNGGGKFLKHFRIVGESSGQAAPRSFKATSLGVELGHAANLAMGTMASDHDFDTDEDYKKFAERTTKFYEVMKSIRSFHEEQLKEKEAVADKTEKFLSESKTKGEGDIF